MQLTCTDFIALTACSMARASSTVVLRETAKLVAKVTMLYMVSASAVVAANDEGLAKLHRVVDAACECAKGKRSGMAAALSCTQGPREFGRLKVMHRAAWDEAARIRAGDLEKVIQSCLSNALSASEARARLGQPPIRVDGSIPDVYWKPIALAQLLPGWKLVRIVHKTRGTSTGEDAGKRTSVGMVEERGEAQLELLRARRDGGGRENIVLSDVEQAWEFIVSDKP